MATCICLDCDGFGENAADDLADHEQHTQEQNGDEFASDAGICPRVAFHHVTMLVVLARCSSRGRCFVATGANIFLVIVRRAIDGELGLSEIRIQHRIVFVVVVVVVVEVVVVSSSVVLIQICGRPRRSCE